MTTDATKLSFTTKRTFEFADYVAAGLCDASVIHDDPYTSLMRFVDPKSYFSTPEVWKDTAAIKNFRCVCVCVWPKIARFRQEYLPFASETHCMSSIITR